jgi:hypothetical protein
VSDKRKRVATWGKPDRAGNDTAFALVDLSIPEHNDEAPRFTHEGIGLPGCKVCDVAVRERQR